jgi:hypothetical protein
MRVMLLGTAAVALMALAGCTSYPAAIQTAMAQALPPYHQDNDVDMDTSADMAPVQSATHPFGIRVPPFTN